MSELAILVPVLGRPHRVKPLLDSIEAATPDARVVFIADPDDLAEIEAIRKQREGRSFSVELLLTGGNYAKKVNRGISLTSEPLLAFGADDLEFIPGWFERARRWITSGAHVVGLNDLLKRSRECKATHFLLTSEYAERPLIDGTPGPLCELYDHSWVDDEFQATADKRKVYVYAEDARIRHLHPMGGGEDDDTYRKGRANFHRDRKLFLKRCAQWT